MITARTASRELTSMHSIRHSRIIVSCDASSEAAAIKRAAARLLRPSMQQEMEESVAMEPERYPLIPGTGGFGKHGGNRPGGGKWRRASDLLFHDPPGPSLPCRPVRQNEKESLTHAERNEHPENRLGNPAEFGS